MRVLAALSMLGLLSGCGESATTSETGTAGAGGGSPSVCGSQAGTPSPAIDPPAVSTVDLGATGVDVYSSYVTGHAALSDDLLVIGMPNWLEQDPVTTHPSALTWRYDGTTWSFEGELVPTTAPARWYGDRVAVTHDGSVVVVGDRASAYPFRRVNGQWVEDPPIGSMATTVAITGLDVSDDRIAIGNYEGNGQSSVEIYRFDGASWGLEVRFEGDSLGKNGNVVAIGGERLAVSHLPANSLTATIHELQAGTWTEVVTGAHDAADVAIDGDEILFGPRLWRRDAVTGWTQCEVTKKCGRPCDVAIRGDYIAVNADFNTSGTSGYLLRFDGAAWVADYELSNAPRSVAINGWTAAFASSTDEVTLVQFAPKP